MLDKRKPRDTSIEKDPYLRRDEQAQLDDLGNDPGQVGPRSAGQSGDPQGLSHIQDASEESVEELADTRSGSGKRRCGGR